MSARPPSIIPRKQSGVRVMLTPGEQLPLDGTYIYTDSRIRFHGKRPQTHFTSLHQEILNHCFDDVERFMSRLQQTAEAQSVLNQRSKKRGKKSKKKENQDDDLLTMKALPPSESEFVDIFQKIKYSFCLLHRLKSSISHPDAPELLHHIFTPLKLMVKTTGGPALGASVVSPAMTGGAISLLREHVTEQENELWTLLGPNWTSSRSQLSVSAPSYAPVFLDGWQPQVYDPAGQPLEDPIESQHQQDAAMNTTHLLQSQDHSEVDGNDQPQNSELLYCCSYDFVARNSSELSVLQGETLEVIESSKRWWKCRNRFGQVGFVPFNMLEPLSAVAESERENPVLRRDTKQRTPNAYPAKYFSYAPTSPVGINPPPARPHTMVLPSTVMRQDDDRVLIVNDELIQRLTEKRAAGSLVPRSGDAAASLNYQSSPAEVKAWLTAKGFSGNAIQSLGVLNGAQLFSLNKEELRIVIPDEGSRLYSQILVQKSILEDVHKATELEAVMQKQKLKSDQVAPSQVF